MMSKFKNFARTAQLTVYRVRLHKAHCTEAFCREHASSSSGKGMSAKRHPSFGNNTELDEDREGGTPLDDLSPRTTPTLTTRESEESDPHRGVATDSETSTDEEDDEKITEDDSLLGIRRPSSYGAVRKTRLSWDSLKNKFRLGRRSQSKTPTPVAPRCECHPAPRQRSNKARNRLLLASGLTLVFMIAEVVGAYGGWVGHCTLYTPAILWTDAQPSI